MAHLSHRAARLCTAVLLSLGLLLTAGACGFNDQTLQPYDQADGVNLDIGEGTSVIKVRDLLLISGKPGEAILSGTMVSDESDALVGVSGTAIKGDNSDGSPLKATVRNPVALGNGLAVVLTDRAPITLKGADLEAGLDAHLELKFSNAGTVKVTVPVVNGNEGAYKTVSPAPSAPASSSTN